MHVFLFFHLITNLNILMLLKLGGKNRAFISLLNILSYYLYYLLHWVSNTADGECVDAYIPDVEKLIIDQHKRAPFSQN